jgi:DNA ligase (NAD+)
MKFINKHLILQNKKLDISFPKYFKKLNYKIMNIETITKSKAKELIQKLIQEVKDHNIAYYQENAPKISDAEYDQLFFTLKNLEEKFPQYLTKDSPTQTIGSEVLSKFDKHEHKTPMLSLANGFDVEDINNFIDRIKRFLNTISFPEIYCEPKIDGVSFSASYIDGKLMFGATRGDGYIGENITANIKTIINLPHKIDNAPQFLEIRGEIFIEKNDFLALNQQQEIQGKPIFANPRNAASGSLRQLDSNVTRSRPLKYFTYAIGYSNSKFADTQQELLEKLKNLGFQTNRLCNVANSIEELMAFYQNILIKRNDLKYEIDGVVYKINNYQLQDRLGFIARSPRFAIAHKFPAILANTKLLAISVQVGRTGALTPVAELKPVQIGGVVVSRATLHNFDEIKRLDLKIGDIVILHRAGDVIPKVTAVDLSKRDGTEKSFSIPTQCPSCGSIISIDIEDVIVRCNNGLNCPKQLVQSIIHFASKDALDIDGLGSKQIEFLQNNGLLNNPIDIFLLEDKNSCNLKKLEKMNGWGTKSVQNLFENINKAKNTSLARFIYSLGIRQIGQTNAKILAKEFISAKNFLDSMLLLVKGDEKKYSDLRMIEGFAEKTIDDISNFFSCSQNIEIVNSLIEILQIENYQTNNEISEITGLNIIFTGTLSSISRSEAKSTAEKLGARIVSSVSSTTDLVILGEKAGSKLKKAEELGIKIISEQEWIKLTNNK